MTYLVRYRVGAGGERKVRVKNCNNKEHAEMKFRAWAARNFEGYVAMLSVEDDQKGDIYGMFDFLKH